MELASRGLTINYDYRTGDVPSITLPANFDPTLRSSYPTRSNSAANDTIVHTIETAYRLDGSYPPRARLGHPEIAAVRRPLCRSQLGLSGLSGQAGRDQSQHRDAARISYFVLTNNPGYPGATGNFPSVFLVPDVYAGGTGDDSLLLSNYRPTRPRPRPAITSARRPRRSMAAPISTANCWAWAFAAISACARSGPTSRSTPRPMSAAA